MRPVSERLARISGCKLNLTPTRFPRSPYSEVWVVIVQCRPTVDASVPLGIWLSSRLRGGNCQVLRKSIRRTREVDDAVQAYRIGKLEAGIAYDTH